MGSRLVIGFGSQFALEHRHTELVLPKSCAAPAELGVKAHKRPVRRRPAAPGRSRSGAPVGTLARTYVPGGVLIDLPYDAYEERLADTREALAQGAPAVYEAAFRADGVFVSVDILEREGNRFS